MLTFKDEYNHIIDKIRAAVLYSLIFNIYYTPDETNY